MRVIVPLKGLLQGPYGIALGSILPLMCFYFMQLRPKRNAPPSLPDEGQLADESEPEASIAERAVSLISRKDMPYVLGEKELADNPYDALQNPEGCIELGLAENKLCLDLLQDWLSSYKCTCTWDDKFLGLKEVAGYVNRRGLESLRTVLARFMGVAMGGRVKFEGAQMVVTAGATSTIEMMAFCLAQPGDAFLVPAPYYAGFDRDIKYRSQVELVPVHCYSYNNFSITRGALESAFLRVQQRGTKVRAVLLTSPSNPVGNVLDTATLSSVLSFVKDKNIHLVADEIYAACVFTETKFVSVAEVISSEQHDSSRVHIIYGLSKDLGLAGFRVGVLYSWNKQLLDATSRLARFCAVSSQTQKLLVALLSDMQFVDKFLVENRRRITERQQGVVTQLEQAGIKFAKSMGGLYCWINLRHLLTSISREEELKLWRYLLYKAGLHLTPGSDCWCDEPGWFRLCFAGVDDETMAVALQRIQQLALGVTY